MISANKIFIVIVSIVVFIVLIYSTYLGKNYSNFKEPYYEKKQDGIFSINLENENLTGKYNAESKGAIVNYINNFDKVLSYNGKVSYFQIGGENQIIIKDGIYLINISELNSKYTIKGEGFQIKNNGPSSIYIDTTTRRKTIFSLNSVIDLELIDIEKNEKVNNIYLYPHKYIRFFPERNPQIKNADLLRITFSAGLDYFNDKVIIDEEINPLFTKNIISKTDIENKEVEKMFMFLYKNNIRENKILKELKTESFGSLVGENLIKKYNNLFLNDGKKIVYYKNIILRGLGDLVKSEKIETSKSKFLIESLSELKELDQKAFTEMKVILEYYSSIIINGNKNDINSKINFSKIYNELINKNYEFKNENILILNDIFFNFDFFQEDNLYTNLQIFNENNIKNELSELEKSYFIFFLNKIIIYGFDELVKNKEINIEDILNIFNIYTDLSLKYYDKNEEVIIRTGINEYDEIIKIIAKKIKDIYFNRNEKTLLLERKTGFDIKKEEIEKLEVSINKILKYYNNKKDLIPDNQNNLTIKKSIERTKILYDEYFLALKDENIYIATYDERNKEVVFGNNEQIENKELNNKNAIDYLNTFNYLDKSNVKISIKNYNYCNNPTEENNISEITDPYCYKIEDLIIGEGGKSISFLLHPFNFNNISNFIIDGDSEKNKGSYRLDNEKIVLDERYNKSMTNEEKEKYSFKNFFLYTFNPPITLNNNLNISDSDIKNIIDEESEIVKFLKRNRLLGNNGNFSVLKGFINTNYNGVLVKEIENGFDINVVNANINYQEGNISYKGFFSSKYIYTPNNSFIDPSIILYDDRDIPLLNSNKINIFGEFKLETIKEYFNVLFEDINYLFQISTYLESEKSIKIYDIIYIYDERKFLIRENDFELSVKNGNIETLNYKGEEIIENPIKINKLPDILKLIK